METRCRITPPLSICITAGWQDICSSRPHFLNVCTTAQTLSDAKWLHAMIIFKLNECDFMAAGEELTLNNKVICSVTV